MTQAPRVPARAEYLRPRHQVANVATLLATHAGLASWCAFAFLSFPWWGAILLSVLPCLIHQRAMSEWIHEASHYNLLRDPGRNDTVGNVLAAFAFLTTIQTYRSSHLPHHARQDFFVPEDGDTGMHVIATRREFRRGLVRDALGINALETYTRIRDRRARGTVGGRERLETLVPLVVIVGGLLATGNLGVLVAYYGTLGAVYPVMNRLRSYGQHVTLCEGGGAIVAGSKTSRTIEGGILDRLLVTSSLLLFHYEHHAHPNLPYRALSSLCAREESANRYARRRLPILRGLYRALPESQPG